ncbi:hypothetical protein KAU45_00360 [bacterium]|nr:hypothetical protein [bacterium]
MLFKNAGLLLLIFLLTFLPLACGEEEEPTEDGEEVEPEPSRRDINLERFGVTFSVSNVLWDSGELIQDPVNNTDTALLRSPETGAYLSVFCQNLGRDLTPDDRDLALEDKLWELEPMFPNMTEVGRVPVELAGVGAVRVEFTFDAEGVPWRVRDWTLVKGQTLCGIQFAAPGEDWDGLLEEIEAVLDSFNMAVVAAEVPL